MRAPPSPARRRLSSGDVVKVLARALLLEEARERGLLPVELLAHPGLEREDVVGPAVGRVAADDRRLLCGVVGVEGEGEVRSVRREMREEGER